MAGEVAQSANTLAGVDLGLVPADILRQYMLGADPPGDPDNPEAVQAALNQLGGGDSGTVELSGDDRPVPYGPRRRDTATKENQAKLEHQELGRIGRDRPPAGPGIPGLPEDAAYGLIGQDRARAERAGTSDAAYGLAGQDFARAQRGAEQEGKAGDETRRSMERDTTATAADVKARAYQMDEEEVARIAAKMVDAGLMKDGSDRFEFEKVWALMVDKAADRFQYTGAYLTPEDMIDLYGSRGIGGPGSTLAPGQPGGPSVTDVTTGVTLSDSTQAWGLLRSMLRSELGRNPSDSEVDDFQAALNEAQRASPEITSRTTSTDLSGNQTIGVTRSGGVDPDAVAQDYLRKNLDSEYTAYQASTTYASALMDALGATVKGV